MAEELLVGRAAVSNRARERQLQALHAMVLHRHATAMTSPVSTADARGIWRENADNPKSTELSSRASIAERQVTRAVPVRTVRLPSRRLMLLEV